MAKTASLVFFYFGESSYVNRLAQETVPLHKALEGYDKAVLLRHETDVGGLELSEPAEDAADVLDLPTKENLVKYLNELGDEGYVVDLFIFSHGSRTSFRVSKGTYGDNTQITDRYLEANVRPLKLRLVWGCNCWGSYLNDTWKKLGARVSAGARYVQFYPTQFSRFINRWNRGETFSTAVREAVTKTIRTPVQAYLIVDAAGRLKEWGGKVCPQVLGKGQPAEDYFRECWLGDYWSEGKSGKQNMNYASFMVIEGDRKTTKSTVW
jgi:hypothetical protein